MLAPTKCCVCKPAYNAIGAVRGQLPGVHMMALRGQLPGVPMMALTAAVRGQLPGVPMMALTACSLLRCGLSVREIKSNYQTIFVAKIVW